MPDPIEQPGNDDAAIADTTDEVVATWREAARGKEPTADADDFAQMRDGFREAAARDGEDPTTR